MNNTEFSIVSLEKQIKDLHKLVQYLMKKVDPELYNEALCLVKQQKKG